MNIIGLRFALLPCLSACLATVSSLSTSLLALDQVGEPPKYLTEKFRADWRMKPLKGVLDELGHFLEKPLVRSASINALGEDRLVALVADKKITLRETLELLESSQDLHFTAETLRLRVETWEDFRDRKRHPVNLSLRDYAVFSRVPDFPAPSFGYVGRDSSGGGGGGAFSLFKMDAADSHASGRDPDGSEVVNWLQKISSNGGLELRGHGNVFILATDEEEAAMRKALLDVHARMTQGSGWRVTFGTLPANETFTSGIVPTADAAQLAARLHNRDAVTLQAINGQRVNAATRRQQAHLDDLDVVSAKFDPVISVLNTGHSADLRPTMGMNFTLLSFHLAWVDPLETATVDVLHPGYVDAGSTASTTTNEKEKDKDAVKTVSVTHESGTTHGGEQIKISKPTVWSWQPRGECYLAKGSALIFAAEHAAGRALIIVQEIP